MCFSFEKFRKREEILQTYFFVKLSKTGTSDPLIEIQPLLTFAHNT